MKMCPILSSKMTLIYNDVRTERKTEAYNLAWLYKVIYYDVMYLTSLSN